MNSDPPTICIRRCLSTNWKRRHLSHYQTRDETSAVSVNRPRFVMTHLTVLAWAVAVTATMAICNVAGVVNLLPPSLQDIVAQDVWNEFWRPASVNRRRTHSTAWVTVRRAIQKEELLVNKIARLRSEILGLKNELLRHAQCGDEPIKLHLAQMVKRITYDDTGLGAPVVSGAADAASMSEKPLGAAVRQLQSNPQCKVLSTIAAAEHGIAWFWWCSPDGACRDWFAGAADATSLKFRKNHNALTDFRLRAITFMN